MRAYPLAMLGKPALDEKTTAGGRSQMLKPPSALDPVVPENKKQVDMHLSVATSVKNTSKLAVVRTAISRRVKHALELIVVRGANSRGAHLHVKGRENVVVGRDEAIVLDDDEAKQMGPKWILNGWMYIFHPTLQLYRMPYHELILLLRWALQSIHMHGMYLEHQWAEMRMKKKLIKVGHPRS
ncbi:hypothetical protein AX15_003714 [Amanita polypyramis BW_CC]|nr:hypothetical protein AX15_003714 [Amanita polypyramis BW_CC]